MPRPADAGRRYMPGLDGLRALAVAAVVAYHLGVGWAPGGLLGVGVFFTLSGYLITDILLSNWETRGSLRLPHFWAARARRLLPALAVMLAIVTVWGAAAQPAQLGALRGDVAAAAVYASNWWLIFQHVSYFARFGPPSPLGHLWSLAVEEQFYLIWPWLIWAGLFWAHHRRRRRGTPAGARPDANRTRRYWPLAVVTCGVAVASALEMALLYQPSFDPSRVYDGTDTRAFGLLFGAALAMVWPSKGLRAALSRGARRLLDAAGAVGLITIALLISLTNQYSAFIYRGGLVILSLATVLVVGAVAHPGSRWGRLLGWRPLRWLGERSYGVYLWHYPIIVLTTPTVTGGFDVPRAFLQVGATLGVAELSWRYVETPVRHGALGRLWAELRAAPRWRAAYTRRTWLVLSAAPITFLMAAAALTGMISSASPGAAAPNGEGSTSGTQLAGTTGATTTSPPAATTTTTAPPTTTSTSVPPSTSSSTTTGERTYRGGPTPEGGAGAPGAGTTGAGTTSAGTTGAYTTGAGQAGSGTTTVPQPSATTTTARPKTKTSLKPPAAVFDTSCEKVVHIGDSTSESLVSSNYLPDAAQRLPEQYARVGVKQALMRIQGGTSIVETIDNEANAQEVAEQLVRQGYHGCWVLALGTNDAADVYVGSNVGMAERVKRMMAAIGNQPVLWVNVKTLLSSGPYSEANMARWDKTLVAACAEYPNMRVFNWAGVVKRSWYTNDGIHYNSPGSAPRAAAIADALASAFPAAPRAGGTTSASKGATHAASCVVNGAPDWDLPAFHM